MNPIAFAIALSAAILYPFGVLFSKRAMVTGASSWQVNIYSNLMTGVVAQGIWGLCKHPLATETIFDGMICGSIFFMGQIFVFAALRSGDVSLATPLLGSKVVLVALLAPLIAFQKLRMEWMIAAVVCFLGILLISSGKKHHINRKAAWKTASYSLCAALAFAFADVLIQRLVEEEELLAFVPLMFGTVAVLSLLLYLPIFGVSVLRMEKKSQNHLLLGTFVLGLQAVVVCVGIAMFRDATSFNIVYNGRSVFSVLLVIFFASYLGIPESQLEPATLRRRMIGALLIFASVLLVLF